MDKFLVVLICLMAVTSAERLSRQFHSYNQQRPYTIPGTFQRPSELTSTLLGEQEPANYGFKYDVDVPEYGTKFGHEEQRQGNVARGFYYVLLPDGRTQVVEYTADQDGYHPTISYQGGGSFSQGVNGGGGYDQRLRQGGFRGHGHY